MKNTAKVKGHLNVIESSFDNLIMHPLCGITSAVRV